MVYYFTGTGNSGYVAKTLANFLGMTASLISEVKVEDQEAGDENILFVFPVYSWGVPPIVENFILKLGSEFWENVDSRGLRTDCVMVCGDEVALAPEMFEKILGKFNIRPTGIYSVIMPNNYVLLPGFDVDSKAVEEGKLEHCQPRIMEIAERLARGEKTIDVVRGNLAWLKTKIVYPLFKRWGIFPKKWRYTFSCISCGRCERVCPVANVKMENGHPKWGSRCCSCLACYHICPVHAVEYGKATIKKGQYFFPLRKDTKPECD